MNKYLIEIQNLAKKLEPKKITIMEVCGGHTNTIMKYGIRDIIPKNIKLISGPGCPVCVTSQQDIDNVISLAENNIPIATFGDMLHVKGTKTSLEQLKSKGKDITLITDANQMLKDENKNKVFFAIGFETTTPIAAYLLKHNITIYPTNKIMIPPMKAVMQNCKIDGFILPGHVSTIIGSQIWEELKMPQVISGFKKDQIIRAIYKILKQITENKNEVINDYDEVVKSKGNQKARKLIRETMQLCDASWRGFNIIPKSGVEPKNPKLNAKIKYSHLLQNIKSEENRACKCPEIIKGLAEPRDCKLFGKLCTHKNPIGPCMVSRDEGACAIAYKYLENK